MAETSPRIEYAAPGHGGAVDTLDQQLDLLPPGDENAIPIHFDDDAARGGNQITIGFPSKGHYDSYLDAAIDQARADATADQPSQEQPAERTFGNRLLGLRAAIKHSAAAMSGVSMKPASDVAENPNHTRLHRTLRRLAHNPGILLVAAGGALAAAHGHSPMGVEYLQHTASVHQAVGHVATSAAVQPKAMPRIELDSYSTATQVAAHKPQGTAVTSVNYGNAPRHWTVTPAEKELYIRRKGSGTEITFNGSDYHGGQPLALDVTGGNGKEYAIALQRGTTPQGTTQYSAYVGSTHDASVLAGHHYEWAEVNAGGAKREILATGVGDRTGNMNAAAGTGSSGAGSGGSNPHGLEVFRNGTQASGHKVYEVQHNGGQVDVSLPAGDSTPHGGFNELVLNRGDSAIGRIPVGDFSGLHVNGNALSAHNITLWNQYLHLRHLQITGGNEVNGTDTYAVVPWHTGSGAAPERGRGLYPTALETWPAVGVGLLVLAAAIIAERRRRDDVDDEHLDDQHHGLHDEPDQPLPPQDPHGAHAVPDVVEPPAPTRPEPVVPPAYDRPVPPPPWRPEAADGESHEVDDSHEDPVAGEPASPVQPDDHNDELATDVDNKDLYAGDDEPGTPARTSGWPNFASEDGTDPDDQHRYI
jgi:hypothetical protein